ncbi:hypothetical protein HDV01_002172 [Terramyces sp. JEL0728]|nr:hypothetical protein HDV01_002172 [Terramyces sp. JEL0728]
MSKTLGAEDTGSITKNALEKTRKIYLDEELKKKPSVIERLSAPRSAAKPASAYISRKATMSSMGSATRPSSKSVVNAQGQIKNRDTTQRKYDTTVEKKKSKLSSLITAPAGAVPNISVAQQSQMDISKTQDRTRAVTEKTLDASPKPEKVKENQALATQKRAQSPRLTQKSDVGESAEKKQRPKSALSHWESAEDTHPSKDDVHKGSKPVKPEGRPSVGNTLRPNSGSLQRQNSATKNRPPSASKNRPTSGSKRPASPSRKTPPPEEKPAESEVQQQAEATNELIHSLQNKIARLEEQNAKLLKERDRLTRDLDNHMKANVGERTNVDHLKAQFTEQHAQNASLIVHNRSLKTQVYELEALIETLLQTAPPDVVTQVRSNLKQFG